MQKRNNKLKSRNQTITYIDLPKLKRLQNQPRLLAHDLDWTPTQNFRNAKIKAQKTVAHQILPFNWTSNLEKINTKAK